MRFPAPDDWDEQQDGYCILLACIPNSEQWRALYRGQFYQPTWWKYYDPEGPPFNQAKSIANQVYEGLCMANCDDIVTQLTRIADALEGETVQQTKAVRELTAVLGSLSLDLTQPVPDNPDYSSSGLADKFRTSNWIAADENLADILANSLMGRYPDPIPSPLDGEGIADILDEQIDVLHNRFRMADTSIWNLFGEKNITETLETLFRIDSVFDLEILSNITSVLDSALNTGDATAVQLLKNLVARITADLNLPPEVRTWLEGIITTEERLSHADILLMIATAFKKGDTASITAALKELEMQVNVNNYNGCGCDDPDCTDCGETQTLTLDDLDCDTEIVNVNGNGTG